MNQQKSQQLPIDLSSKTKDSSFIKYETAISISEFVKSFPQRKLVKEFDYLCQITETQEHEKQFFWDEKIQHLNRYIDILPYKHTMVTSNINEKFYINANYIRGIDNVEKKYIATQGPIPSSVNDFWHMIWTNEVGVIIMLCKLEHHNFRQCEKYWPEISNNYGPYQVKLQKTQELKGGLTLNELIIKFQQQDKLIHHYQWNGWPDLGVVDQESFFLIDFLANIANQSILKNKKTVVHCSAGIGRTGTLLKKKRYRFLALLEGYVNKEPIWFRLKSNTKWFIVLHCGQYRI